MPQELNHQWRSERFNTDNENEEKANKKFTRIQYGDFDSNLKSS